VTPSQQSGKHTIDSMSTQHTIGDTTDETSTAVATTRAAVCGCAGCRRDPVAVINHREHGTRVVCAGDINGHEVIRYV